MKVSRLKYCGICKYKQIKSWLITLDLTLIEKKKWFIIDSAIPGDTKVEVKELEITKY